MLKNTMILPTVNDIATLSIVVSEEIEAKHIDTFLRNSILNSKILTSQNSYYSYYYNIYTLTYEVVILEHYSNAKLPEPFNLISHFKINDEKIRVFIREKYFIISKYNKLMIFKPINNSDRKEVISYIKQFYKIDNFEIVNDNIDISEEDQDAETDLSDIYPLYPKKSFSYFIGFVFLAIFILLFLIYQDYSRVNEVPIKIKSTQENNHILKNSTIVSKVPDVFSYLKTNSIEIKKLLYINNQLKTSLMHKDKSKLLSFMNEYKANIRLKSLKYDELKSLYLLDVSLEF